MSSVEGDRHAHGDRALAVWKGAVRDGVVQGGEEKALGS